MKRALFAASNMWGSDFRVGSHHLAASLLDLGWSVAFVSDPISPLHPLGGVSPELKQRFAIYRRGGQSERDGRLWAYVPGAVLSPHDRPLLRSEWVLSHWPKWTIPNVVGLIRQQGFAEVDLLYVDSVAQSFWLDEVHHARSVFRIADQKVGFGNFTEPMKEAERTLARSVDLVVYTAEALEPYVRSLEPGRMALLRNGVNFAHFFQTAPSPPEYQGLPRPILIYVGTMRDWFDFSLVRKIAAELPSATIVLVGPDEMAAARLRGVPNIKIFGPRPYTELPAYLQNADVGLIPFDVAGHGDLVDFVHPLKMYEYMACGLPVVARAWGELRLAAPPIALAESDQEFLSAIRGLVEHPPEKSPLIQYARRHDWRDKTLELLRKLDFPPCRVSDLP